MDWVCFLGLNPNSDYAGQEDNGNCYAPGEIMHRLTKNPAYSASRMYAPRVMPHRYNPRPYNCLSRRAGPCGAAMPTRGRGVGRQCHATEGWQGADRLNIDETAVCFVEYCSMLTRVRCVLFFFLQMRPVSEKSSRRAVGSRATPAHRTARPTHTLHIAPRWRLLTAFAWLPYSIEHTHQAAAAEQQQQHHHHQHS